MSSIELNETNFEEKVAWNGVTFIDFWATWCGPCKSFGPIFDTFAGEHPEVICGKINVDDQQELAAGFGVQSIPTLGIFRDGILLYLEPGLVPAEGLSQLLTRVNELDMDEIRAEIAKHEQEHGHECNDPGCGHHHE